jgi:hypothetical protein
LISRVLSKRLFQPSLIMLLGEVWGYHDIGPPE